MWLTMETRHSCFAVNQRSQRRIARTIIASVILPEQRQFFVNQKREEKMDDKVISHGWHYTYGWLRRREEDRPYGFCYEDGDGDLVYTANPRHRDKCYLECREDITTGERYLCLSSRIRT